MQPKDAPWNSKNSNVLIIAGNYLEEFALKYGVCILPNRINLIPCKYLAPYNNNVIKYLFEIIKNPLDDCNADNTIEIRQIIQNEAEKGKIWFGKNEFVRFIVLKKISEVGPIINDYISKETHELTPLTIKIPRYTTLERIKNAKLTSELKCEIDIEEFEEKFEEKIEQIVETPKKNYKNYVVFSVISFVILLLIGLVIYFSQQNKIVKVEVPVKVYQEPQEKIFILEGNTFESGKSSFKGMPDKSLLNIVSILKSSELSRVIITGHTDNVGLDTLNKILSEERAKTIRDFFIKQGIDSNKIEYYGKGASEPKYDNSTNEGRALNRRTEIKIISK